MPVSADEVRWCYRLLLGREPESEKAVRDHQQAADRSALIRAFLTSTEFTKKTPDQFSVQSSMSRFDGVAPAIDSRVTPEQLAKLMARVKACWTRLGASQPHWSVLSDEQFRPANLHESVERFWQSGAHDAELLTQTLERIGVRDLRNSTCVEYGCGMGRVTSFLGRQFGRVIGYDISAQHLAHARERLAQSGARNIEYRLVADDPLAPLEACDVYFSRLVLQHNPPPLIRQLLIAGLTALRPGGVAVFQVATHISGYRFDIHRYLLWDRTDADKFEVHCLPQHEIFDLLAQLDCTLLELHEDGAAGRPHRRVSNLFVVRKNPDGKATQPPAAFTQAPSGLLARLAQRVLRRPA